jgi:hypothetical protein
MDTSFRFRSVAGRWWLAGVFVAVVAICLVAPPAFWVCGVGVFLLVIGALANSARTGSWATWHEQGDLDWFEGWVPLTGVIMVSVPLLMPLFRIWAGSNGA